MAFKMSGFNPGKGTGMSKTFAKKQAALKQVDVELNPDIQMDPRFSKQKQSFGPNVNPGIGSDPSRKRGIDAQLVVRDENADYHEHELGMKTEQDVANEEIFNNLRKTATKHSKDKFSIPVADFDNQISFEQWLENNGDKIASHVGTESAGRTFGGGLQGKTINELMNFSDNDKQRFMKELKKGFEQKQNESANLHNDLMLSGDDEKKDRGIKMALNLKEKSPARYGHLKRLYKARTR